MIMEKLTQEQKTFAEEHHTLVYRYLRIRHLPYDEYYDIAIFGYLRSVVKYLTRPELRQYSFTTIAFSCMDCDVYQHYVAMRRPKRNAQVVSIEHLPPAQTPYTELSPEDLVVGNMAAEDALSDYSERERRIISLSSAGYGRYGIAEQMEEPRPAIQETLEQIRSKARNLFDDTLLAA